MFIAGDGVDLKRTISHTECLFEREFARIFFNLPVLTIPSNTIHRQNFYSTVHWFKIDENNVDDEYYRDVVFPKASFNAG
jgi:hypothetical protein